MDINAIILAAGTASRFVPLSNEIPKGLLEIRGEILIERQLRQLKEAGINDITVVVGYKKEMFEYLKESFGVSIVYNPDFQKYNNISSIIRVIDKLHNTYILTSDNYYPDNIFLNPPEESYYSAIFNEGETDEYCMTVDEDGYINNVTVGGKDMWFMYGPAFFCNKFSKRFREILIMEYDLPNVKEGYWEDLYIRHLDELKMRILPRKSGEIEEFDSIDELRNFDESYIENTRSHLIAEIAHQLNCSQSKLHKFKKIGYDPLHFSFLKNDTAYEYYNGKIKIKE